MMIPRRGWPSGPSTRPVTTSGAPGSPIGAIRDTAENFAGIPSYGPLQSPHGPPTAGSGSAMGGKPAQLAGCAGMGDNRITRSVQSVYAHERSSVGGAHQLSESNTTGVPDASLRSFTGV